MATSLFIIHNTFSTVNKFIHQTCIAGLIEHWTHLRVNGICAKSFCPQKTNNRTLFLIIWDAFSGNVVISNVYKLRYSDVVIKLIADTQN